MGKGSPGIPQNGCGRASGWSASIGRFDEKTWGSTWVSGSTHGHAAAPENQALFDMDMEKTEGELVGIHEEVKTLNATMKGKLVNDD